MERNEAAHPIIEATPSKIVGGCLENIEKSLVGEIEPTAVVVSEKENMETLTKTMGHKLTNREESPVMAKIPEDAIGKEEVPLESEEMRPKRGSRSLLSRIRRSVCPTKGRPEHNNMKNKG